MPSKLQEKAAASRAGSKRLREKETEGRMTKKPRPALEFDYIRIPHTLPELTKHGSVHKATTDDLRADS